MAAPVTGSFSPFRKRAGIADCAASRVVLELMSTILKIEDEDSEEFIWEQDVEASFISASFLLRS